MFGRPKMCLTDPERESTIEALKCFIRKNDGTEDAEVARQALEKVRKLPECG